MLGRSRQLLFAAPQIKLGTVSDEEVDELVARTDLPGSAKVTLATLPGLCAVLGDDRRLDLVCRWLVAGDWLHVESWARLTFELP